MLFFRPKSAAAPPTVTLGFTGQLGTINSALAHLEIGGVIPLTTVTPRYPLVLLEIDWTDNPTATSDEANYVPFTSRIRSFSSRRGRPTQFERVEAGTATVVLNNRDGYFNWTQTNRLLLRRARLSAYWDHERFPILSGYIESFSYDYPGMDADAVCVLTISEGQKILALQEFPSSFERVAETTSARVGAVLTEAGVPAALLDVNSATINNSSNVAPVRVIEGAQAAQSRTCTLVNGSTTVTLTSGTTDGLAPGMVINGAGIPQGSTIASVTDASHFVSTSAALLSANRRMQVPDAQSGGGATVLSGDTTGLSVGMLVGPNSGNSETNLFGSGPPWQATITGIQGDSVTITPPTRQSLFWDGGGPQYTNNVTFSAAAVQTLTFPLKYFQVSGVLEHIRQLEATERGLYVVLKNGVHQYQGVNWRTGQSPAVTFGENEAGGEIPYAEAPLIYDDTGVTNQYVLRNVVNETETVISDTTSQARYFTRVQAIDQLWQSNITSLPTAQRVFEPIVRIEGISVQPVRKSTLWRSLLGLEVSQLVTVKRRAMGGSDILTTGGDQFIEGIEHDADPSDWRMRFITWPR